MPKGKKQELLSEDHLGELHHDLKNKLASIKAFSQLINLKSEDKEIVEYSEKIDEISEDMLKMMNGFFDEIRQKK